MMQLNDILDRVQQNNPEKVEQIRKIADEVSSILEELNTAPGLIGWDLILFRTKQLLLRAGISNDDLQILDREWARTTKSSEHRLNLFYDPPRVYNSLLHDSSVFDKLVRVHDDLRERGSTSFREIYLDAFFELRKQLKPTMTKKELEVFRETIRQQTTSPSILSEKIGTTKGYVSRVVKGLLSRGLLSEVVRFSYGALSLKVVIALVEMESLDTELPDYLTRKNPWLYSLFDCKYANRVVMANFIVTMSWRSREEMQQWKEQLLSYPSVKDVKLIERDEKKSWMSFDYSRFDGKDWNVIPGEFGVLVKSRFREQSVPSGIRATVRNLRGFKVTNIDVQMIAILYENGALSIREIRQHMGLDYNTVRKAYNRLKERGVIWNRIHPSPLIAPENITLVVEADEVLHAKLCSAFSICPEVYAQRGSGDSSIFMLRLPDGHGISVGRTLNEILRGTRRVLLQFGEHHFTNWKFPLERWDDQYKEFRLDSNDFGGVDG